MIPLFKRYARLGQQLPYAPLAALPTPVTHCPELAERTGAGTLCVKRDDRTGADYGGNKVRKLAFLLGHAQALGATSTITFGAAGSNHALATAIYARNLGLQPISMLVPQCNAHSVRRNLLHGLAVGATLVPCESRRDVARRTAEIVVAAHRAREGRPYIIPAGGSAPLGTVGFVDAALELAAQVGTGELALPDVIYVASGTMGTGVGLLIGLQLAGLPTKVVAVRVTSAPFTSPERARQLYGRTLGLLRRLDPAVPALKFPEAQFALRDGYLGAGYGRYTEASVDAVATARAGAGLALEGTYTGKALACLLDEGRQGQLAGKNVLYWNTYNGVSQEAAIKSIDYHQLPGAFHRYYEKAVQELDR